MPRLSWVKVVRQDGGGIGDPVYAEANYVDAAGSLGSPFESETGTITFETLDGAGTPNWRARQVIAGPSGNSDQAPESVILKPVSS